MPSDLNLKKSWNPKLLKNREKVWEKEHQIYEEYKRNQQYQAKLQETKEKDELLSLVDKTKPAKKDTKTDWIYHSPAASGADSLSTANEDVLLGRTRIQEGTIKNDSAKITTSKIDKVLTTGVTTARPDKSEPEQLSKTDPLYAIKLQQLKRKELMEKQRKIDKYKKRETERKGKHRHSHHHHRHHHRHDDYKSSDEPKRSS